ncbi:MAG: hypothetical protein WDA26_00035 [Pusillimonas sp.]
MTDFREMILAHKGKRICVMGGAPSLADDLAAIDADMFISTNGHGANLVTPDYLLAMDEIHKPTGRPMDQWLREHGSAPIISPHPYADIRLSRWPQEPRFVLSGMIAIWAAYLMGAKLVIVAGMDAYGGEDGYITEARKIDPDVNCPVRVASGPLTDVWPAYKRTEKFGRFTPSSAIGAWIGRDGEIKVRVIKATQIRGRDVRPGDELMVMRNDVAPLLRHRMLREV